MNNQNKKIDVYTKYFIPVTAGIETNILETYSVLSQMGWDIMIHTSADTYLKKNSLQKNDIIKGLKVTRYPFSAFGFLPNIDWKGSGLLCLHNFDIFPHFQILLYSLLLKLTKQKKFKIILTPHGGFNPEWSVFPLLKRLIKRAYHRTLGVLLINICVDGIRAVSEWERTEMIKYGVRENLIEVISNGIEDEAYADSEELASSEIRDKVLSYGSYIIQIGRVYPIKNYETAIRALSRLPKSIKYVIAGPIADTGYKHKLDTLISELELQDRVIFVGVIRGVDKYYLIKHALAMVHMAIWESFCNVVHEGMSQGLVCLVAENTALPYLVKNDYNGWCIATYDDEKLAERILYLVNNSHDLKIKSISERNRDFGLAHSWRGVAQKMDKMYSLILDDGNINVVDYK